MELRVGGKYKFTKKLGNGAFGDIYSGVNIKTNEDVAIKLLQYEAKLYKVFEGGGKIFIQILLVGLSTVHYFGVEGDYNVMVMDILGPSLENLFQFCERQFSYKTIMMMLIQCIERVEFLHSRDFIHRDIKPENFLIGVGKKAHLVYTIDFGLAKRYKDPKTGSHIVFKEGKGQTGTARYASLNMHLGYELSRRDDLEAVGYMIAYFVRKGNLPWMGLKAKTKKDKNDVITNSKALTTFEELFEGHPVELMKYMKYSRALAFDQKPDYSYLKKMLEGYLQKNGYDDDQNFDWVLRRQQKVRDLNPQLAIQEEEQKLESGRNGSKSPTKRQGSQGLSTGSLATLQKKNNIQNGGRNQSVPGRNPRGLDGQIKSKPTMSQATNPNLNEKDVISPKKEGISLDGKDKTPKEPETEKQQRDKKRKEQLSDILVKEDQTAIKSKKKGKEESKSKKKKKQKDDESPKKKGNIQDQIKQQK
ncbi:casein kinase i [Stylonychia lemnae]|uniref:Casein kinase I n=1 Tax=Stylonychia lemnae TaxID=5949 RepID=A0A078B8C6_STYLE|nr:casein kinase i [Stylonychia lemnae]|eukprot:CDW90770.1 casein kinase i [Stylonychia lemnae]